MAYAWPDPPGSHPPSVRSPGLGSAITSLGLTIVGVIGSAAMTALTIAMSKPSGDSCPPPCDGPGMVVGYTLLIVGPVLLAAFAGGITFALVGLTAAGATRTTSRLCAAALALAAAMVVIPAAALALIPTVG